MHACTHARMHACARTRMHARTHAHTHTHTHANVQSSPIKMLQLVTSSRRAQAVSPSDNYKLLNIFMPRAVPKWTLVDIWPHVTNHEGWDDLEFHSNILKISNTNQILSSFEFDYNIEWCQDVLPGHEWHDVSQWPREEVRARVVSIVAICIATINLFVYFLT